MTIRTSSTYGKGSTPMKSILLSILCALLVSNAIHAWQLEVPPDNPKISPGIKGDSPDSLLKVWVLFTDKCIHSNDEYHAVISHPEKLISDRALRRRTKTRTTGDIVDFHDIPVCDSYIEDVFALAERRRAVTKWFNGVSIEARWTTIQEISSFPFVRSIRPIVRGKRTPPAPEPTHPGIPEPSSKETSSLPYGPSATQNILCNIPELHDLGFSGDGVLICVLDGGFQHDLHEALIPIDVLTEWDFIDDDGITDGPGNIPNHGTSVLSICAGYKEDQLIGPAFGAEFILGRTEDVDDEYPLEEDFWTEGVEWADSAGADIITSSLAYIQWLEYEDLDGNTATSTNAADWAAANGILVCNAIGNSGPFPGSLEAPSDADSIVAVGSIDGDANLSGFSSRGPTADGRIKPEVLAMGEGTYNARAGSQDGYGTGGGTSFSTPIVAGIAALILENHYEWNPMQVREALMMTASNSANPDNNWGYGIVNALQAVFYKSIGGMVTDVLTSQSIPQAEISYTGPQSGDAETGGDGRFLISDIDPGIYEISVTADGYYPKNQSISVPPWTAYADFALIPEGTEIPIVNLEGYFIDDSGIEPTEGDGDAEADINETVGLDIVIFNDGNREVTNAEIHCSTESQYIDLVTESISVPSIDPAETTIISHVAVFSILPETPHTAIASFDIRITGEDAFDETFSIELSLSAEMPSWPLAFSTLYAAPKIIDLDDDGDQEILFGDEHGYFNILHHDGSPMNGWPVWVGDSTSILSTPAVVDIDGDDEYEILTASEPGLFCWHIDGTALTGWPPAATFDPQTPIFISPMVADLDADGDEEVIMTTVDGFVLIWDHLGNLLQVIESEESMFCVPAIGDVDGDGDLEIVSGSGDTNQGTGGRVFVWNHDGETADGMWPVILPGIVLGGIALADLDNDGAAEIIVPESNLTNVPTTRIHVFRGDGEYWDGWPQPMGLVNTSQPAVADLDGDGIFEIIVPLYSGMSTGEIQVWSQDAVPMQGWPRSLAGVPDFVAPLIGDINGDGSSDIVIASTAGGIYAFDATGNDIDGFPFFVDEVYSLTGIPIMNDIDGDQDVEIVISSLDETMHAWDLPGTYDPDFAMPWGMARHDYRNTSNLNTSLAPAPGSELPVTPVMYRLWQNAPNPMAESTSIRFDLPESTPITLALYDLMGRRVETLVDSKRTLPGSYTVFWNGTDELGRSVGSGIYFYRLVTNKYAETRALIRLR